MNEVTGDFNGKQRRKNAETDHLGHGQKPAAGTRCRFTEQGRCEGFSPDVNTRFSLGTVAAVTALYEDREGTKKFKRTKKILKDYAKT